MGRFSYSLVVLFDGTVGPASENEDWVVADHVFGMSTLTLTPPLNSTHTRVFVQAQSARQRLL